MKRWAPGVLVLAGVVTPAASQDVAETIREAVLDFNLAYERNDLDAYFGYYADDCTLWFDTGRVELEDYREEWYELEASGGGVETATVSDLRVRVSPSRDTAVATYVLDVVTRYGDGRRVTERAWETDVWFLTDGEWKIVHIHYSPREIE